MKKKISAILFGLLFLVGFGILIYPTVSNQWNTYRQSQLISNYQSVVQDMTPEDFTQEWERAEAFNATITQNNLYSDVFGESTTDLQSTEYWKILNEAGDGITTTLHAGELLDDGGMPATDNRGLRTDERRRFQRPCGVQPRRVQYTPHRGRPADGIPRVPPDGRGHHLVAASQTLIIPDRYRLYTTSLIPNIPNLTDGMA